MDPTEYSLGQQVRVLDCPQHLDRVGFIIDVYRSQVRIAFPDGTRCWPRRVEPVNEQAVDHPEPS
jgi:hypothetical protein